jgi:hypothetical protein
MKITHYEERWFHPIPYFSMKSVHFYTLVPRRNKFAYALSCSGINVLTVRMTSPSISTPYHGFHPSGLQTGGNLSVLDQGCWVDGVKLCNKLLWWLLESSNLCTALHCHDEARFLLDSCETELIWNASSVLSASLFRHQTWLSPVLASHPHKLLLHSPRRQSWSPCPLMGDWEWCHSTDSLLSLVQNDGPGFISC